MDINRYHQMGRGFHDHMGPQIMSNIDTKYTAPLLIYFLLFLSILAAAYFIFNRKKIKICPVNGQIIILTLLCLGLILRIYCASLIEGHNDINLFKNWASAAANNLLNVYSNSKIDYPPLYLYILFIVGKIGSISVMTPYYTLLLKLPSIFADIAASYIIYRLSRKYLTLEMSILISAFYIFNPAIFINSAFWGQVDSFFTLLILLAIMMLCENKWGLCTIFFTAAVLMKPQGIIFLPILFFEVIRQIKGKNYKDILKAALIALCTVTAVILPFSLNQGYLWIYNLYTGTAGEYPYASVNAFNFFYLMGANYKNDASTFFVLSYHNWGMIFIVTLTLFSWLIYIKGDSRIYSSCVALSLIAGVFTFSSRMHERYLFPAIALSILCFIYLKDKRFLMLSAGFSITSYINTHIILFGTLYKNSFIPQNAVVLSAAVLNVLLIIYLGKVLWDIAVKKKRCVNFQNRE